MNQKLKYLPIIIALFFAYLIFPSNLINYLYPIQYDDVNVWKSLDPSWQITLNYVNLKELTWGKDFVFTFGPLGYLSTKFLWGQNVINVVIFDLFVSLNFFFLVKEILKKVNVFLSFGIISLVFLCLPNYFGSSISLVLLALLTFWILKSFKEFNNYYYILPIILLFYLFFIKINTGLVAFVFYYFAIIWNFINKRISKGLFAVLIISPICIIYIASIILKVDLINYIINSLEIIDGYNQIMYLNNDDIKPYFFFIFPLLVCIIVLISFNFKKINKQNLFINLEKLIIIGILCLVWFIIYKQAFLRGDIYHVKEYFILSSLLVLVLLLEINIKNKIFSGLIILLQLVHFGCYYSIETNLNLKEKFYKTNYYNSMLNYNKEEALKIFPNDNKLPDEIISTIGTNSVDCYPWNSYMLFENKLNFTPRPVFQSYTTYSKELQNLNFEFYNSNKAPRFIIYELASIDERNSYLDDMKLNLLIKLKYKIQKTFSFKNREYILYERMNTNSFKFVLEEEFAIFKNSQLTLEENKYYEIEPYLHLKGIIYSILHHTPDVKVRVTYENNSVRDFRTSPKLLQAGIFSNKIYNETKDLITDNKDNLVKNISFVFDNENTYKDKFRIKKYKITQ